MCVPGVESPLVMSDAGQPPFYLLIGFNNHFLVKVNLSEFVFIGITDSEVIFVVSLGESVDCQDDLMRFNYERLPPGQWAMPKISKMFYAQNKQMIT